MGEDYSLTEEEYERLFPRKDETDDMRLRCGCMIELCLAETGSGEYTENGWQASPIGAISGTITETCERHAEY